MSLQTGPFCLSCVRNPTTEHRIAAQPLMDRKGPERPTGPGHTLLGNRPAGSAEGLRPGGGTLGEARRARVPGPHVRLLPASLPSVVYEWAPGLLRTEQAHVVCTLSKLSGPFCPDF